MDIIALTLIGIISRLVPHIPNVTPVGATALFASSTVGIKKGLIIVLLIMLTTDIILGLHPVMWATYGSFMITLCIGRWIQKRYSLSRFITGTLLSSVAFFVITNFAVWIVPNGMYERSIAGIIRCYVMAIPFFRNSLIGDMLYGLIFYYGYETVKHVITQLKTAVHTNGIHI